MDDDWISSCFLLPPRRRTVLVTLSTARQKTSELDYVRHFHQIGDGSVGQHDLRVEILSGSRSRFSTRVRFIMDWIITI